MPDFTFKTTQLYVFKDADHDGKDRFEQRFEEIIINNQKHEINYIIFSIITPETSRIMFHRYTFLHCVVYNYNDIML